MPERRSPNKPYLLYKPPAEIVPPDHFVWFLQKFLVGITDERYRSYGIEPKPSPKGGVRYAPQLLLGVLLFGFMSGIRSMRKLEEACQLNLALRLLTGEQVPDHNTLWRFYKKHRAGMRKVFRETVTVSVKSGMVSLALQAVDGTKIAGNAARDQTMNGETLGKLLERLDKTIAEIEALNGRGDEPSPPRLPAALQDEGVLGRKVAAAIEELEKEEAVVRREEKPASSPGGEARGAGASAATQTPPPQPVETGHPASEAKDRASSSGPAGEAVPPASPQRDDAAQRAKKLEWLNQKKEQVIEALEQVYAPGCPSRLNLTDADALLLRTSQGYIAGHNNQAAVAPLDVSQAGCTGRVITATKVVANATDYGQLPPMLDAVKETTGSYPEEVLADGGYLTTDTVKATKERGVAPYIPESKKNLGPYAKSRFIYDEATNTYICPEGKPLSFTGTKKSGGDERDHIYQANKEDCAPCPFRKLCIKQGTNGRMVKVQPVNDEILKAHREAMETEAAKGKIRQRKGIIEPVFGTLKDRHGARRFLLRGLENVAAEWDLLAAAFNLRTFAKIWRRGTWNPNWEVLLAA